MPPPLPPPCQTEPQHEGPLEHRWVSSACPNTWANLPRRAGHAPERSPRPLHVQPEDEPEGCMQPHTPGHQLGQPAESKCSPRGTGPAPAAHSASSKHEWGPLAESSQAAPPRRPSPWPCSPWPIIRTCQVLAGKTASPFPAGAEADGRRVRQSACRPNPGVPPCPVHGRHGRKPAHLIGERCNTRAC
jgi:hypothetical protein